MKNGIIESKELRLEYLLDNMIDGIKESLHYTFLKKNILNELLRYIPQYQVCDNKYKIDFYFPNLKLAVEYGGLCEEKQLEFLKHRKREYEIMRYFYINDFYNKNSLCEAREKHGINFKNIEEVFDYDYENGNMEYTTDIISFERIEEKPQIKDIFRLSSSISESARERINEMILLKKLIK